MEQAEYPRLKVCQKLDALPVVRARVLEVATHDVLLVKEPELGLKDLLGDRVG